MAARAAFLRLIEGGTARPPLFAAAVLACCALGLAACDGTADVDGTRSPCAAGGQILGCDEDIETSEDACWKLVQCGVFPLDEIDDYPPDDHDYFGCIDAIEGAADGAADIMIECVALSSCDALATSDGPYDWPDCLHVEGRP